MRRFIIVALVALAVLTGCQSTAEDYMSVSVSGSATVTLTPDMASFSISVSETGQTTWEAQQQANAKMQDIYDILHEDFGIVAEDIRTTSMSLYPEYRYEDGQQILVGQTASQSISVTVHRLDDLALIVDRLSSVTGISLSSISLDASEKDESMSQARRLAMQDAMDKAWDYAEAAGLVLGAPVSVRSLQRNLLRGRSRRQRRGERRVPHALTGSIIFQGGPRKGSSCSSAYSKWTFRNIVHS